MRKKVVSGGVVGVGSVKEQISKHRDFLALGDPNMSHLLGSSIMPQKKAILSSFSHFLMILNSILSLSSAYILTN